MFCSGNIKFVKPTFTGLVLCPGGHLTRGRLLGPEIDLAETHGHPHRKLRVVAFRWYEFQLRFGDSDARRKSNCILVRHDLLGDIGAASVGCTSEVQFLRYRPIKNHLRSSVQKNLGGVSAFLAVYIFQRGLAKVSVLSHMVQLSGPYTIWSKESS